MRPFVPGEVARGAGSQWFEQLQAAQKGPDARRIAIRGPRRTESVRRRTAGAIQRRRWAFFSSLLAVSDHRARRRQHEAQPADVDGGAVDMDLLGLQPARG